MDHRSFFQVAVSLIALLAACSSSSPKGPASQSEDGFGNAKPGGTSGSTGSGSGHGAAGGSSAALTPDSACGIAESWGELTPVDMLVMFDRSGSMKDDHKWEHASAALTAFFEDPAAADLDVALRFFPHDRPTDGCTKGACDADACAVPLIEGAPLTAEAAPMDAQEQALVAAVKSSAPGDEGGGTPMHAALDGALRWADAAHSKRPESNTVVVFVTDGKPNGCDENFNHIAGLAADALASSDVRTYAIGLTGSSEQQMNQLAQQGGTDHGIFISAGDGAEQALLDALDTIRGKALACDFPLPAPVRKGDALDLDKVSVTFVYDSGAPSITLAKRQTASECNKTAAWYYDDPSDPQRIVLCPSACKTARAGKDQGLQILLGCARQEVDCNAQLLDPACTVD